MKAYLAFNTPDRNQARIQLELLGYKPGDNIYMRFFVPDGDPRHGTPAAARKANKLNWEEVERYQNDGYGVYFVINGGGHTDKEVEVGRALFCEWDDRPIEDQVFAWQQLNLPEPSMQVGTRKSVHNYWRADLTKDQWRELQQDLLAYTQSDQKLKNPSRVLRLAGSYHIKPGCEPVRCDIIHQSEKVYSYEELRAAIPRRQQPTINHQPSITDDVPLYQCLTKGDRALIDQGAAQGSRNDSGAKLARNLIGTAQRLNHLGIHFSDDPHHLFHDYCYRCTPSLSTREAEAIWKSALKDNPTPSLTDEALENCAKAWIRNQEKSSGWGYSGGIGSSGESRRGNGGSGGSSSWDDPTERKRLELKAIAQERDPYKFTDKLIEFCRRTGWTRRDAEQQIRLLKTSTVTPKAKRLKGKDFLALETESISWVFPGIIPSRGVFVVGGHAGTGKTTFAYDAVGSLLLEEEFLGEKPVKTGKVLIVTGDELPCFTQDKLIDRGIPLENEDWEIILNWDVSQWDELESAIADIRPALVIIDSFSSIHRDPNFDENSSQAKSTIYDLEALTNAYNCGCILIHHLSKSKENQGVAKLRGSSAIAAAASVVCLMEQTSDGTRKLSFPKVRGAQTDPFLVALDGSTGRYEVVSGGDASETKCLGDRILAFLQKYPYERYEQEEISKTLGIPSSQKDSVYQALGRLFKRGLITKRPSKYGGKRKVYGVTNPSQLSHSEGLRIATDKFEDTHTPLAANVSVQIDENIDINGLDITDTLADSLTDTELTPQTNIHTVSNKNPEAVVVSVKLTDKRGRGCVSPLSVPTVTLSTPSDEIAPAPTATNEVIDPTAPTTSNVKEASAPTALEKPIRVGDRVEYVYQYSKRCGMLGVVRKIDGKIAAILLDYHKSLTKELRKLESPLADLRLIE